MNSDRDRRAPRGGQVDSSGDMQSNPSTHDRGGDGADQALSQEQEAVRQMGQDAHLSINEGGRTNDSYAQDNPKGAVHGLPQPALKGTWR